MEGQTEGSIPCRVCVEQYRPLEMFVIFVSRPHRSSRGQMTKIYGADGRPADVAFIAARQCAAPGFHAVVRFQESREAHAVQGFQEQVGLFRTAVLVFIQDDDVHVVISIRDKV